jgi:predicted membrane channel-forming protein YqfA (hemolysin III family)
MNLNLALFCSAVAFVGALGAYPFFAQQKGLSVGKFFQSDGVGYIGLACLALLAGAQIYAIFHDRASIWSLLWGGAAYFLGSMVIVNLLGRLAGPVAIFLAPLLTFGYLFFR